MMTAMKKLTLILAIGHALPAFADGAFPKWFRMPKAKTCENTFADPIAASSSSLFSTKWDDDVRVSTPQGTFVLTRSYAGARAALGQTMPDAALADGGVLARCREGVVGSLVPGYLKAPFGNNLLSQTTAEAQMLPVTLTSLTAIVDTTCPTHTRVLTPEGDTRFFAPAPTLSNGQTAWVARSPDAQSEPSRLRVSREAGVYSFDWFHEDGRRINFAGLFAFPGANGQYRLKAEYRADGRLFYEVTYAYPVGSTIPGASGLPSVLADGGIKKYPFPERTACIGTCACSVLEVSCPQSGGQACTQLAWDPLNCGSCGHACTATQYCRNGSCGAMPTACEANLEPVQVTFPHTDLRLEFIYMNPPSVWSLSGIEFPNSECVLARVDAVHGTNREALIEYEYDSTQTGSFATSLLSRAILAPEGGPNAWAKIQPGLSGSKWALGITEVRSSTSVWNEPQSFVTNTEHIVEHGTDESGSEILMSLHQEVLPQATTAEFFSRGTFEGCTNCCSREEEAGTYGRRVLLMRENSVDVGAEVRLTYYGQELEDGGRGDWRAIYGPLPAARSTMCTGTDPYECQSSDEQYFYGRAGLNANPPVLNECEATNQPVVELARRERNSSFTQENTIFNAGKAMLERESVARGATSVSSADALETTHYTYAYGASGQQLVSTVERPSLHDSGKEKRTTIVRDSDVVSAVVRDGVTLKDGHLEYVSFAVFYKHGEYPCSKLKLESEYVAGVVGPCSVSGAGATDCNASVFNGGGVTVTQPIPITEFYYYGAEFVPSAVKESASTAFNSGRVALIRQYPNGCSSTPLDTVFGSYSATGQPGSVTDPSGAVTTMGWEGELLTSIVQPGPLTYSIDWDRGRVTRVTRPEGDSTVYCTEAAWAWFQDPHCFRADSVGSFPGPIGLAGQKMKAEAPGTLHRDLAWVADVAKPPGLRAVRMDQRNVDERGQLQKRWLSIPSDSHQMWSVCADETCMQLDRYQYDFERRPVFRATGGGDEVVSSLRYNVMGSVVAQGSGFDFTRTGDSIGPACSLSGTDDPRCTYFARDRLERLTGTRWPMGNQEDCVAYDAHGNISVIARGCYNGSGATACPIEPTTYSGLSVSGGATCGERMEFIWDDFGNLIASRRPSGLGTAMTSFEYDAAGAVVQRHSTVQDAAQEVSWTTHDGLGRLLESSVSRVTWASTEPMQLTRQQWDSAPTMPEGCGSNFTSTHVEGRVAYSENPVWNTWHGYDALGRTVAERRILQSAESCTGDGDLQPQYNTTRYGYRPNGSIASIQYPSGRDVTYVYPEDGEEDNNLPTEVKVRFFGEDVTLSLPIVTKIHWTADQRLKSYRSVNYSSLTTTGYVQAGSVLVEYDYGSKGLNERPRECGAGTSGGDGTGRVRRIRVVSDDTSELLYERWFTWVADQLSAIDVCYPGQIEPLNEFNTPEAPWGFDALKRLEVNNVVAAPDEVSNLNLTSRRYHYDLQGNRLGEFIEDDGTWGSPGGWDYQYGGGSQLTRVAPASHPLDEMLSSRGATTYLYDADGRQTQRSLATNANNTVNATVKYIFPASPLQAAGGVESVLRTVELDGNPDGIGYAGLVYNYYYDGDNKRIRKEYPDEATEDFFYDLSKHLIAERSFDSFHEGDGITMDEYIYLGDLPVAALRSYFTNDYTRAPDFIGKSDGKCSRRNEWGHCGLTQLVAETTGRPVLALSHLQEVTGVGEYDAFGFRNRVRLPGVESAHPIVGGPELFASSLGKRPVGNLSSDFRARVGFFDAAPVCVFGCAPSWARVEVHAGNGGYLTEASGAYPNFVSAFVTGDSFDVVFNPGNAPGGDGAVLEGYDYDRRNSGNRYFPPMRFPGQYYDEETDIHENWNRFYDPARGSYLSPEPMLQSPTYVRLMAGTGMSVPTYAYAASNPLKYVDPDGLRLRPNWSDQNMVRTIIRLTSTAEGRALWDEADRRPEDVFLISRPAAYIIDKDEFQWGHTPRKRGNQACYVDTNPEWDGTGNDPAVVLGHEIEHALTNLTDYNMSQPARELKSTLRDMIIEMQLSK